MLDRLTSNETLRLNVKYYRVTKGYTQEKISDVLKVTEKYYSLLENGHYNFTLENLDIIAEFFNKKPWELLKERHGENEVPSRVDIYKTNKSKKTK